MNTIRHLLVAFHDTEDSKEALSAGMALSKQLNADLSVLHVSENETEPPMTSASTQPFFANRMSGDGLTNYPVPPAADSRSAINEEENHIQNDRSGRITAEVQSILQENRIPGQVKVLDGNPSDAIISYAEEIGADLIVVGHRNISGFRKLISSSVSDKVANESVIPVLIAK
ncbi:universal stress protein [Metabacillus sp. 84]|uniref:universal stress protein n=1 Tax=unclassified Metabacillus TaxID=2675274 RepID=UPI003CF0CA05